MGYRHIESASIDKPSRFVIDDETVATHADRHAFISCMSTWVREDVLQTNKQTKELELTVVMRHAWRFRSIQDIVIIDDAIVLYILSDELEAIQAAWSQHHSRLTHNRTVSSQRLRIWQIPDSRRKELAPYL